VILTVILASAALLGVAGRAYRNALQRRLDARFSRGPDGIIRGAEPMELAGSNGAAVLLVHGGGDTPQSMRGIGAVFHERGYTVHAPLLPGHGRDLLAFDAHDGEEWYAEVVSRFRQLQREHAWVGVVGLSMGGALSARLASEFRAVSALVLASPYLSMPPLGQALARTSPIWGFFAPVVGTSSDRSVFDPEARAISLGYGAFTSRSLRALYATAVRGFASLPSIDAPTLVIQSVTDNRIRSSATELAFARIGSTEKRLEWIEGAGHVITVDYGWQRVGALAADWMDAHRPHNKSGGPAGRPPPAAARH
jgi:carboxylesterase